MTAERQRHGITRVHALLVGKWLTHDDAILPHERAQHGIAVLAGQKSQAPVSAHDLGGA